MVDYFIEGKHKKLLDRAYDESNGLHKCKSKSEFTKAFANLVLALYSPYNMNIRVEFAKLKSVLAKFDSTFKGTDQHDTSEALNAMLGLLNDDLFSGDMRPTT